MTVPSRRAARRIALARVISLTGSEAAIIALVFALYQRTHSSLWISAALLVSFWTLGLLTPVAGSLGDRLDRRLVMVGSDLLGAVCFASLAVVRSPAALLVLAFSAAVVEAPFFPAATAAIPNLVTADDLAWANGTIAFGSNVGYLAGPALGGALAASGGVTMVFLLNAASFVVSAALVASVRGTFSGRRDDGDEHRGLWSGVSFLFREPVLRTITLAFAVFAVCVGSVLVAELPLAASFHTGSVGYGLIATAFGVGALLGSLAGRLLTESNERRVLVYASFVTAAGFGAVAPAPAFAVVLGAMLVAGASDGIVDVAVSLIVQRRSPDAVRSRVVAALEGVFLTSLGASFLFAGWFVESFGPKPAYALAGAGCAVAALMLLPLLRRHSHEPVAGRLYDGGGEPERP